MTTSTYLQFFIGLVAILNPFGMLPVFIGLTSDQTKRERRHTNTTAVIAAFITLVIAMFIGQQLLQVFGISMPSFRIAGGVMLFTIALSMLKGHMGEIRHNREEKQENAQRESVAVVPLAIPLLAGPGSISSVIVYATHNTDLVSRLMLIAVIAAVCVVCWLVFYAAPYLVELMGRTGINIITRVMGLIMIAIGVEFLAQGLRGLFPLLAGG